jgi:hypothetical protein
MPHTEPHLNMTRSASTRQRVEEPDDNDVTHLYERRRHLPPENRIRQTHALRNVAGRGQGSVSRGRSTLTANPRTYRGVPPSLAERALIARLVRQLPPLQSVEAAHRETASGPNVFLAKRSATAPLPPWAPREKSELARSTRETSALAPCRASKPRRRSFLPLITLAMAAAICVGLARDATARTNVVTHLVRAQSALATFVAKKMPR